MNRGHGFQRAWWLVLITIGVMYTSLLPFAFFTAEENDFLYMLCGEIVLIIPVIVGFFMLFWEQLPDGIAGGIGFRGFPVRLLPFVLLLAVTAQTFSGFLLMPIQSVLIFLFGGEDYSDILQANTVEGFLQNFLLLCVAAPIFEEILCRGVLMQLFRRYGTTVMLVYSSLGFALLHMSVQSIIPLFFLGLLLGIIRLTTGSIFAAMAAHSMCNLYSIIMLGAEDIALPLQWLIVVGGAALFVVLFWRYMTCCDVCINWRAKLQSEHSPTGFSAGLAIVVALFFVVNTVILLSRFISGSLLYDINEMMIY